MKGPFFLAALAFWGLSTVAQAQENPAQAAWAFGAQISGKSLQLKVQEIGTTGPACDLVLRSMKYDEADGSMALEITPATMCPVDAIATRGTEFTWQLPVELRHTGTIKIIVNGQLQGSMGWGSSGPASVISEGGQQ